MSSKKVDSLVVERFVVCFSILSFFENNKLIQYSKLNTLLFNLNNTSQALTSSLTALTNMNASK
jgi:hypothetical protein